MIYRLFCLVLVGLLCSCGEKKSTAQLADEMLLQVEALPQIISSVNDQPSAVAAAEKIVAMQLQVRGIAQTVEKEDYLVRPDRVAIERRLLAVQGESAHLLKQLRGKPELLLQVAEPLTELAIELERAKSVMKAPN